MQLILVFLAIAATFTVGDQDAQWKDVSNNFELFVKDLNKQMTSTKKLIPKIKRKCEIRQSDIIETGSPKEVYENCKSNKEYYIGAIREKIKNKAFNRGKYNFEKYFGELVEHCGCLDPKLGNFFKRNKNRLLQKLYDSLTTIDSTKADWKKVTNTVTKFMSEYQQKWESILSSLQDNKAKVDKAYKDCNKTLNDHIIENANNKVFTYTPFKEDFDYVVRTCLEYMDDDEKLKNVKAQINDFFNNIKPILFREMGALLPADEWSPYLVASEKVNWTMVMEVIESFIAEEKKIFELGRNNSKTEDLRNVYMECENEVNPSEALDIIRDLISKRSLSQQSFPNWMEEHVKNKVDKCYGTFDDTTEYESLKVKLTELHEKFMKEGYKTIYNLLPERAIVYLMFSDTPHIEDVKNNDYNDNKNESE